MSEVNDEVGGIRWTAPRHADDHVPTGWYVTRIYQHGPRQSTILFKIGLSGRFEFGVHARWPNLSRWHVAPWIRIVGGSEPEQ